MKAIIVDDEERARDVLGNLLTRFCANVEVVASCENLITAIEAIKIHKPDVVFLDIEMPQYAGYEIVDFFDEINPTAIGYEIVFTTAYEQYAIKAFEVAAIDYLLKPIDIERLRMSVDRINSKLNNKLQTAQFEVLKTQLESNEIQQIVVPYKNNQLILQVTEIIAFEASESYTTVHTAQKSMLVSKNLKHFETIFENSQQFIRTHKSWLINPLFIEQYCKAEAQIKLRNNIIAKLSRYKKNEFEEFVALK